MSYPDTQLYIDGQWQGAADGRTLAVHNPATGIEIGRVAHAGIAELDRALAAAQKGFEIWRDMPPIERAKIMRRAAALMRERAGEIGALLTQEQASFWSRPRAKPWLRLTSSNGSPTRASASMAAWCHRATTWPTARWW